MHEPYSRRLSWGLITLLWLAALLLAGRFRLADTT